MTNVLQDKTIALMATDGFEDDELTKPFNALTDAGAHVEVVSDKSGHITGKYNTEVVVDKLISGIQPDHYDSLLLPGGVANPDQLRQNEDAVRFVRSFFEQHKPVAAICHAPWLLIEADVVNGRVLTSWPSLKTDIENAGGSWVNKPVVVDGGLVTSRGPDDIPAFCDKMIEEIAEGTHTEQTASGISQNTEEMNS